jgi:hypothetical protein
MNPTGLTGLGGVLVKRDRQDLNPDKPKVLLNAESSRG